MNPTIAMITIRGLLGRRRFLVLLVLPAVMVALAALADASDASVADWADAVLDVLGFGVVLPLIALIVGAGVVGSEIDDGTLVHTLSKPLPRWEIIATKLVVAVVATVTAVVPAMFIAGVLAQGPRLAAGLAVGAVLGSIAYCALFLALSLVTNRPVLLGLGYLLLWEGLLTGFVTGTRVLSIREYAVTVADRVAASDLVEGHVSLVVALVLAAVLTLGATALSIDRLRSFRIAGETG
jgi:ABC-2 type transport system permease protein